MNQEIPATFNGCGKKFSIDQAISCPKNGIVIVRHENSAKEWGALVVRSLTLSEISYEPQINSRIVQVKGTKEGALR